MYLLAFVLLPYDSYNQQGYGKFDFRGMHVPRRPKQFTLYLSRLYLGEKLSIVKKKNRKKAWLFYINFIVGTMK